MEQEKLYQQLSAAYSDENLNRITGKLIDLYKNKHYAVIRDLANAVSEYIAIDESQDAKCFSRLVVLYHPDKGEFFRSAIKKHFLQKDWQSLTKYSHILLMNNIENIAATTVDEDIDYEPEYNWDDSQSGYHTYSADVDESEDEMPIDEEYEKSFYDEVKLRMYGDLSIEFPPYYLEDFEAFELADSGIESLDGVAYCKHAMVMDLCNNAVTDISDLRDLENLQELYLANNQIGYIDALSSLLKLKTIDLSGNQIDDISPLFELPDLEYVNLIGNNISQAQLEQLKAQQVIVLH